MIEIILTAFPMGAPSAEVATGLAEELKKHVA